MEQNKKKLPDVPADPSVGDPAKTNMEATTSNDVAATTDEEVKKAVQEGLEDVDKLNEQVRVNLEADADNAKDGAPGVKKRSLFPTIGGKRKVASVPTLMAKTRSVADNSPVTAREVSFVSDMDKFERNERAAVGAYSNIAADILREATQMVEAGDTAIIGTPQQNAVYSTETAVVEETLSGETTKYGIDHPRHRQMGTLFRRGATVTVPTGDYVEGVHDVDKRWGTGRAFRLNKLSPNGTVINNAFVEPKRGKFMIVGFNPLPFKGAADRNLFATNVTTAGEAHYDVSGEAVSAVNVYHHRPNDPGMFKVVNVTPYLENITTAQEAVIRDATCAKGKMKFGLFEALEAQFAIAAQAINEDPEAANLWPDFNAEINRSTLWEGSRAPKGACQACYNEPKRFFEFMEAIRSSEQMWAYAPLSLMNGTNPILWGKGQTGLYREDPFFHNFSGFSTQQDMVGHHSDKDPDVIKGPNAVAFGRYLGATNAFRRAGQWIYTFREYSAKLHAYETIIKEDPSLSSLLKNVHILKSAVQDLQNALSIGRVTADDGITSQAIIKLPNVADMIFDFDPNDLVETDGNKWYLAAGYTNIWTSTDQLVGSYKTYAVAPAWLETLVRFTNTYEYDMLMSNNLRSAPQDIKTGTGSIAAWLRSGKTHANHTNADRRYMPIQIDSMQASLFPHLLMEAYSVVGDKVFAGNQRNAYLSRYLPAVAKLGFDEVISQFYGSNVYTLITTILDNPACKLDPKAQRPDQYPLLYKEARDEFLAAHKQVVASFNTGNTTSTTQFNRSFIVYEPDTFDEYITNVRSMSVYNAVSTAEKYAGIGANAFSDAAVSRYSTGGLAMADLFNKKLGANMDDGDTAADREATDFFADNDYIIDKKRFWKVGNENSGLNELIKQVKVPQFDADTEFIGYSDTPEDLMYKQDGFYFVPDADVLVMTRTKSRYADNDENGVVAERDNYAIVPADFVVWENEKGTSKFKHSTLSISGEQYTPEYALNEKGEVIDVSGLVNKSIDKSHYAITGGDQYTNLWIRSAAGRNLLRPSLYGTKRHVDQGATFVTRDWTSRVIDQLSTGAYYSAEKNAMLKSEAPNSAMMFGFLPEISGLTVASDGKNWDYTALAQLPVEGVEVTDYKFYYQQYMFAGGIMDAYGDAEKAYLAGSVPRFAIREFFDLGNWIINSDIFDANLNADHRSLNRFAQVDYDDSIVYLINDRHTGLLSSRGAISTTAGITAANECYVHPHVTDHPALLSRNTFNDLRAFNVGKPLSFLNRTTRFLNVFTNPLVEQYMSDKF